MKQPDRQKPEPTGPTAQPAQKRPRGRPKKRSTSTPDARAALIRAAQRLFDTHGYEAATIREIAQEAGVDSAMIHHYFGSKEGLFREVVNLPVNPSVELAYLQQAVRDEVAEVLIRNLLRVWDSSHNRQLLKMIRGALTHEWAIPVVKKIIYEHNILPMVRRFEADERQARQRATLIVSQMLGVIMTRYMLKLEPLHSADVDSLVTLLKPTIERYLFAELLNCDFPDDSA